MVPEETKWITITIPQALEIVSEYPLYSFPSITISSPVDLWCWRGGWGKVRGLCRCWLQPRVCPDWSHCHGSMWRWGRKWNCGTCHARSISTTRTHWHLTTPDPINRTTNYLLLPFPPPVGRFELDEEWVHEVYLYPSWRGPRVWVYSAKQHLYNWSGWILQRDVSPQLCCPWV